MELETLCIHGGKVDTDKSGAISTPIYQTATYAHPALGQSTGYDYTRDTNPTRDALEAAMAETGRRFGRTGLLIRHGSRHRTDGNVLARRPYRGIR